MALIFRINVNVFLFLVSFNCFSQGERIFSGRLILLNSDQKYLAHEPVKLVNMGTGVSGTDGVFSIPINNSARNVTLVLSKSKLDILYPVGGITPVPKDPDEITNFIIGESPQTVLTRAVARSNNEIKRSLAEVGIKQNLIEEMLSAFRSEIQELTNNRLADLNEQIALDTKRKEVFPQIATAINNYTNEAKDLKDAFKFTSRHAFEDPQALQILTASINNYNDAFEDLNKKHSNYEKMVKDYWENDAKAGAVRDLFNYALGELHSANIFTLNLKIRDINEYYRGGLKASEKKTLKTMILRDIETSQLQLERRLQELDLRAQTVLTELAM